MASEDYEEALRRANEVEEIPFTAAEKHAKAKVFGKLTEVMEEVCNETAALELALKEIKVQYERKLIALGKKLSTAKKATQTWMASVVDDGIEFEVTNMAELEIQLDQSDETFDPDSFVSEWTFGEVMEEAKDAAKSAREYMRALTDAMDEVQDSVVVPKSDEDDESDA